MSKPGTGLEALHVLHRDVDREAHALERIHAERLQCRRGCNRCCIDGITVFEIEARRIRDSHGALLREARPHPAGACAFLDAEGSCRIYESRPYVCRTQGLPLRWIDERNDRTVELRDICPLNDTAEQPLESIAAADCWTLGEWEGRLAQLEAQRSRPPRRVALRSLFAPG